MCREASVIVRVKIAADLSHTGEERWKDAEIDACIAPIVAALQAAGIDMRSSCCGHGRGDGEILLADGRALVIESTGGTVGDKGDDGTKILRVEIVIARVGGLCWLCGEDIVPGTRVRSESAIVDGKLRRSRTCHACCEAMVKSDEDNGDAIEERYAMGQRAARERQGGS